MKLQQRGHVEHHTTSSCIKNSSRVVHHYRFNTRSGIILAARERVRFEVIVETDGQESMGAEVTAPFSFTMNSKELE